MGFAGPEMRRELSELWQVCFRDPAAYPDFFLSRFFVPENCLVDREGGSLAAAVYLLPARVREGAAAVSAHYIFAAATAPQFRSRGLMSRLLGRAAEVGAARGERCSAVLPSGEGLYGFYAACGYRDFFFARTVNVPAARLFPLARGGWKPYAGNAAGLNRLRTELLWENDGSLLWSDGMFRNSVAMSAVYGDRLVAVQTAAGPAYALCRTEAGVCTVLETAVRPAAFPFLADAVLRAAPAERYRFRLPADGGPFPGEGELGRFGMRKALGSGGETAGPGHPYLGLGMD